METRKPSWLETALELLGLEYEAKPVRVLVLKDLGSMVIDGVEHVLPKGSEAELPRWAARVLEEAGLVERTETEITIEDMTRVHFSVMSARSPAELEQLPRDFYREALEYIMRLRERVRREFNVALLEEQQRAQQYLLEIIDRRLSLILQSVRSPTALAEISGKLAPEEATLLDEIRRDIDAWKKALSPPEG